MRTLSAIFIGCLLAFFSIAGSAQVPPACAKYKVMFTTESRRQFGLDAPISTFVGQVAQESLCNPLARSGVGAQGLTQFMPGTSAWIPSLEAGLAPPNPLSAEWSFRAMLVYNKWLQKRNPGLTECDTYAFSESAYNGGEGWLLRDRTAAKKAGRDPNRWFGHVADTADPRRAPQFVLENRGYPVRILRYWTPRFTAAGWGRGVTCEVN